MTIDRGAADADCKREAGAVAPVIDPNRCEGKGACVEVCPYDVFEMGVLPREARRSLTIMGRIKGLAHGWKQASAVNAQACHACGLCVAACPEKAIVLRKVARPAGGRRPQTAPKASSNRSIIDRHERVSALSS